MTVMLIFDMDRGDNCCQLCLYLMLNMCIFALQVFPSIHMCFNYCTFDLLFNSSLFRLKESEKKYEAYFGLEGVRGVP